MQMLLRLLIMLVVLSGCARMAPPTGGDRDRTPPELIATEPVHLALQQPVDTEVRLVFSKYMNRSSVEQALFISPPPKQKPRYSWFARTLTIKPAEVFPRERTIVITLGAAARDHLGNAFSIPQVLTFSTGDHLDSGAVNLQVHGLERSESVEVWLLPPGDITAAPLHVLPVPDDDVYHFQYLPPGPHELMAVADLNRNRMVDPFTERYAVTTGPVSVGSTRATVQMYLQWPHPDSLALFSLQQNGAQLLQINGRIPKELQPNQLVVTDTLGSPLTIADMVQDSAGVILQLQEELAEGTLEIALIAGEDTLKRRVRTREQQDRTAPELSPVFPRGLLMEPGCRFCIKPGEPLRVQNPELIRFRYSPADSSEAMEWGSTRQGIWLSGSRCWSWADTCRIRIDSAAFTDWHGNSLPDSTIKFSWRVGSESDLGSIAGHIEDADAVNDLHLRLISVNQQVTMDQPVTGEFRLQRIPQGRYTVMLYRDLNGNNQLSLGNYYPFEYSEPFVIVPDTIQVTARWELSGLVFQAREVLYGEN